VLGILASVLGGMLMSKSGKRVAVADGVATTAVGDDASAVGAAIDAVANDVRLRAQGVASTPMLRAAIETDAATLQDMVHDGALFKPAAGEVVDLVQVRDGQHASLLRLPESAKPLGEGDDAHVVIEGGQLRVIAGAPVTRANGDTVAGDVLISAPVDLQSVVGKVKTHALDARLEGIGAPIALVPGSHPDGEPVARPVQSKALKGAKLTLATTVARVMPPDVYKGPAYGAFGIGALLLIIFVAGTILRRGRARGNP